MISEDLASIADTIKAWSETGHEPGPQELATLAFTIRALAACAEHLEAEPDPITQQQARGDAFDAATVAQLREIGIL